MKQVLKEIVLLIGYLLITILLAFLVFNWNIKQNSLSINIIDTYIVFWPLHFILRLFLLIIFLFYSFKLYRSAYIKPLSGAIFLLSGIGFIISAFFISGGYSSYPSLTPLGEAGDDGWKTFIHLVRILQILVSIILIIMIYLWIKRQSLKKESFRGF